MGRLTLSIGSDNRNSHFACVCASAAELAKYLSREKKIRADVAEENITTFHDQSKFSVNLTITLIAFIIVINKQKQGN
jgi:hypothetical protein